MQFSVGNEVALGFALLLLVAAGMFFGGAIGSKDGDWGFIGVFPLFVAVFIFVVTASVAATRIDNTHASYDLRYHGFRFTDLETDNHFVWLKAGTNCLRKVGIHRVDGVWRPSIESHGKRVYLGAQNFARTKGSCG